jgi:DHA1 family bicyclomycin/chloramphenicol resistance-like MFS transporter
MDRWLFTLVIAALAALGPFSVDTYFPSFPAIGQHFGVGQDEVQKTLTYYLLSLAAMTLFHGAFSDSYGRRRVILWSLVVYVATAFGCLFAPTFEWLLTFRVIQGLSAGAGMIVGRAMIRDRFDGVAAQNLMAHATMLYGLAPAVAPMVGGVAHSVLGWQGGFVVLAALSVALLSAGALFLRETLPDERRQPFRPGPLSRSYLVLLADLRFGALTAVVAFGFGGVFLYVSSAPDFVMNTLHLSETEFGWMFVPFVIGLVSGSWAVTRLSSSRSMEDLIRVGFGLCAGAAAWNLVYNLMFDATVPWAVLPLVPYAFGMALLAPGANVMALDLFPERRGLASSLMGFLQVLAFALISGLVAPAARSGLGHAVGMMALLGLSALSYRLYCWLSANRTARMAATAP